MNRTDIQKAFIMDEVSAMMREGLLEKESLEKYREDLNKCNAIEIQQTYIAFKSSDLDYQPAMSAI